MKQREIYNLLRELKPQIKDEFRASEDPEDDLPGMLVTIACDVLSGEWTYQTGCNSFTGKCYEFNHWAVISLYRDSNCLELAREMINELIELVSEEESRL